MASTLAEKVWQRHVVRAGDPSLSSSAAVGALSGAPDLLYIDLHLVHEVTSPQAFEGLRLAGRPVRRPDLTLATMDHNVPTTDRSLPIADDLSKAQMDALAAADAFTAGVAPGSAEPARIANWRRSLGSATRP